MLLFWCLISFLHFNALASFSLLDYHLIIALINWAFQKELKHFLSFHFEDYVLTRFVHDPFQNCDIHFIFLILLLTWLLNLIFQFFQLINGFTFQTLKCKFWSLISNFVRKPFAWLFKVLTVTFSGSSSSSSSSFVLITIYFNIPFVGLFLQTFQ